MDGHGLAEDNLILVVEDNLMNQAVLEELNIIIYFADNGEMGARKAQELHAKGCPPELIFMDMQMPVMDGLGATRQIRSIPEIQNIPVIALSADAFKEQQEDAYAAGISHYLIKPIEMEKVLPLLKKYCRIKG